MSSSIKIAIAQRLQFFSVTYFLLHALVFSPTAFAQLAEVSTGIKETVNYDLKLDYQFNSYLSADKKYFADGNKSETLNTVGFTFRQSGNTAVNSQWFYSESEAEHYFNIRELSHKIESKGNYAVWLGRHEEVWSVADEFWSMGDWQPRFMWDKLRSNSNGLTGIFYKPTLGTSQWHLMTFVSPLYIPHLGPNYVEEDDMIKSVNPWFRTPPPILELFDEPTVITARVDEPEYTEIIFKPSLAFQISKAVSKEENVQLSYAYKPGNSLIHSVQYVLIPRAGDWTADFTVHPVQIYHHLTTLEYNRKNQNYTTNLSWTHNDPIVPDRPEKELSQNLSSSNMYSATVGAPLTRQGTTQVYGGIMYLDGGIADDRGANAQSMSLFEYVQPYFQATKIGISRATRNNSRRSQKLALELLYDSQQEGGIVMSEYAFSPIDNMHVSLKMDFIGVLTDQETEYDKAFINTYKANDRLQMDVNYVF